ncbi:hypothetical protein BME96_06250 [Virgibacillus halodenitrificans]|uniref:Lipoprotein n=1 Tax=Virgibacillus halodenitrificans TaxID=1482 RepID=A0AAC9IXA1_VIRHA|nr:hypothetical protein [Virgibacillus halodenitrificans]APC47796.1 hypothetical protein BME96_06250 [Virgibacillus halodenitrificans]
MKMIKILIYLGIVLAVFTGCSTDTSEEAEADSPQANDESGSQDKAASDKEKNESTNEQEASTTENGQSSEGSAPTKADSNSSNNKEQEDILASYSNEQIEYARVWRQLGPNQEVEEINVRHIPAGTKLNAKDDTSTVYPEDVIQLSGVRLVDGSVTYSGNGDGTINVYDIPLRWDGVYPAGEKFYNDLLENNEQIAIDPGKDKEIAELIKRIQMQN